MHKNKSFAIKHQTKISRYYRNFSIALGAFLLSFTLASIFAPVQSSDATQKISTKISYGEGGTLEINAPDANMSVTASAAGTYRSTITPVNVTTDADNGYQLYMSLPSTQDDGRLYKDGDSSSSFIYASTGTFDSPTALAANSWGFALAQTAVDNLMAINKSVTQTSSFSSSYTTPTPDSSNLWASIPPYDNPQLILEENTPTEENGTNLDVYFGVYANAALPSGTYTGNILYTAIADDTSETTDALAVYPSEVSHYGETITLKTATITTSLEDLGDVKITIGGRNCITDPSIDIENGYLVATCQIPLLVARSYQVNLILEKYNKTISLNDGVTYTYNNLTNFSSCSEMNMYEVGIIANLQVQKLPDTKCWTIFDTAANRSTSIPTGFSDATLDDYNALLESLDSTSDLYQKFGWSGYNYAHPVTGTNPQPVMLVEGTRAYTTSINFGPGGPHTRFYAIEN